jgi:hypothetical protein
MQCKQTNTKSTHYNSSLQQTSQHQQTRLLKQNSQSTDVPVSIFIGSYLEFRNTSIRHYNVSVEKMRQAKKVGIIVA